ncbi:MAG TPA: endonuclease MutS2, partial [Spirochaetia bacterium]|nr:endonuclease MutS2 [Spirochaetia bacterium]
ESIAAGMPDLRGVCGKIDRVIDEAGELKEKEIPELRAIKGRVRTVQDEIRSLSGSYLSRNEYQSYWNSDVATVKDGRTVLPLKAQFKGRIPGIVHEVSTTGATLFIEPAELVEKNNDLVELDAKYRQEVLRIVRELTREVFRSFDELSLLVRVLTRLDTLHARARYAHIHSCFPARQTGRAKTADVAASPDENGMVLVGARHPLLGKKAVPIDVIMDSESRILIITGPNTGGKTVSLKTVGLLAMMNQFGMEIPAGDGSKLPIYDDVWADIGDEQSIEQSLSTFSGHMQNISRILRNATPGSLILLDELGSGTDPEEGSALAMSFLDRLLRMNVHALITTHHSILKNYGYTRPGVRNASMEFDGENLQPTYRIVLGVPGSSHAIDIAGRSGIPRSVVDAARRYLHDEQTDAAGLIRRLTHKEQDIHRRHRILDQELSEVEKQRLALTRKEEEISARELELRKGAVSDLDHFVSETRKRLERLVRELREEQIDREKTRSVKAFLDELSRAVEVESAAVAGKQRRRREETPVELAPGVEVLIDDKGSRGTLVRKGRGDAWVVAVGAMKRSMHAYELRTAASSAAVMGETEGRPSVDLSMVSTGEAAVFELDVRGMRLDEALSAVERQLDRALMQGISRFGIIHGKGEGVLQNGIHRYLKESPAVDEFHFARPEEGGFGKTEVQLRP